MVKTAFLSKDQPEVILSRGVGSFKEVALDARQQRQSE
jgi:hypothetical protein